MRTVPLLLLIFLSSCKAPTWGGAADVLMPDELTVGQGSGTHSGGVFRDEAFAGYEGETETTYAALTWSIPSIEDRSLTRDERQAIRDLYATMDEQAGIDASSDADGLLSSTKKAIDPPPIWMVFGFVGLVILFALIAAARSKKTRGF